MQGTEVFLFRPTRNSNHTEMSIVGSSDLEAASVPVYLMNTFLSHVVSCCSKLPMAIQERRLSSLSILDKHLCVPLRYVIKVLPFNYCSNRLTGVLTL